MSDAIEAFRRHRQALLEHRADYDAARRAVEPRFGVDPAAPFNWALDWLDPWALAHADETALRIVDVDDEDVAHRTFGEIRARSNRAANVLRGLGVERGDRVLLMLPNVAPLWEVMVAAIKLGAVIVPATTLLEGDDLSDRLDRGHIKHVVTTRAQVDKLEARLGEQTRVLVDGPAPGWTFLEEAIASAAAGFAPRAPSVAGDPLLLYFTSGTTSKPKLVLHSHASYPVGHLSTMYWLGLQPGDLHLNVSSPGWAKHAWSNVFAPWNAGAGVFVLAHPRFEPEAALRSLVARGVTTMCAAPTVWRLLIQQDLSAHPVALREMASAGEPLNPSVIEALRDAWGLVPRDGYGQTETTAQIANSPGQEVRLGSMGRAMPGYDVVLLDGEGAETTGEGQVALRLDDARPIGLMMGYDGDRARSEQVLGGSHYLTGDVATMDADGYLTYVGRADDVFKSSGYRISPFELESVVVRHPAVAEAAVVPSPDATKHTVPKAFVALRPGHAPSEGLALDILRFARAELSPFKRVRRLEFAELPKTVSGKIRRVALRDGEAERVRDRPDADRGTTVFWSEDFGERLRG
ncbi:MAG: AMP-binding protein [Sandaracinaceae bacterium]